MIKIGIGYDVHKLHKGNAIKIGGVNIPAKVSSVGHSDGDALCHAIVDALLGAAGLGDIGKFFPNNNKWRGAQSKVFLIDSLARIKNGGYKINNVDATIILQTPRLENYIIPIRKELSKIMDLDEAKINIKATTTDGLGTIGDGLGWAVLAVVSLIKLS